MAPTRRVEQIAEPLSHRQSGFETVTEHVDPFVQAVQDPEGSDKPEVRSEAKLAAFLGIDCDNYPKTEKG